MGWMNSIIRSAVIVSELETLKCVILENHEITGYADAKDLLELGGEELFVIDLDGLNRGSYNFKLYNDISKFFETTIMSFPVRAADLVDCIVAGASRVVVSSNLDDTRIRDFIGITDELVMNYANMKGCRVFSDSGGMFYLSNRTVDLPFERVFLYGGKIDAKGYTNLEGFPEFITEQ